LLPPPPPQAAKNAVKPAGQAQCGVLAGIITVSVSVGALDLVSIDAMSVACSEMCFKCLGGASVVILSNGLL